MPVPSPRNKILPARGNYVDLVANVASILDGEICYAIDQDQYYQNEAGALVSVGATKAQGALADSSVQPLDNVSTLTNDAGYITLAEVPGDLVTSVQGRTGDVVVTKADLSVENVDNTSDANKPVSTAQQTALDTKADLVGGFIPTSQIPAIAITEFLGSVGSEAAMLTLAGQPGDWCLRTDKAVGYVITGADPSIVANWEAFTVPGSAVTTINSQIGDVVLGFADVGAASAAQGALADTATQPGDNNSTLTNDAGYITLAEVPPGGVTSVNTQVGDVVLDAADVGAVASSGDNMTGNLTLGTDRIVLDATAGSATFSGETTHEAGVKVTGGRLEGPSNFQIRTPGGASAGNIFLMNEQSTGSPAFTLNAKAIASSGSNAICLSLNYNSATDQTQDASCVFTQFGQVATSTQNVYHNFATVNTQQNTSGDYIAYYTRINLSDNLGSGNAYGFFSGGTAANYFAGNVGIGTDGSATKLAVFDSNATNASNYVGPFSIENNGTNTNDGHMLGEGPSLCFRLKRNSDGTATDAAYIRAIAEGDLGSSWPTSLSFACQRFGSDPVEHMRIDSTGSIGIGTDNPQAKLDVSGTGRFTGTLTATVVPPSDARFKENITPANSQLADVVALGGILKNYDWNEDAPVNDELRAQRQLGLIAQEAGVICPGIVKDLGSEEDSYKGISQDALVMKLLGAVAELTARVEELEAER